MMLHSYAIQWKDEADVVSCDHQAMQGSKVASIYRLPLGALQDLDQPLSSQGWAGDPQWDIDEMVARLWRATISSMSHWGSPAQP